MTKREMVNHMIEVGCIKAEDYNIWMRKLKDSIERVYNEVVPRRIEYLNK